MDYPHHPELLCQLDQGVLSLQLNRPARKNALHSALYLALEEALHTAHLDPAVKVVVLRGDQDFSAGNDLQDFASGQASAQGIDAPPFKLLRAAARLGKPLVVAVRGVAVGIGSTLLLHADLVYCDQTARFGLPFVSLGLSPEGGSSELLVQRAGYLRAAELLLLAEPFDAQKALAAGLVTEVVADPYAHAAQKARRLTQLPTASVQLTKAMLRGDLARTIDLIDREADVFVQRTHSPEMQEALNAFAEKRAPDFSRFDRT